MPPTRRPVHVTRSVTPDFDAFSKILGACWESGVFTSGPKGAPMVNKLEKELAAYFDVPECVLVANGTVAITMPLRAFGIEGEVVTTPFSYVATANAIEEADCEAVFADIDPHTFNVSAATIDRVLTPKTRALIPVHVFGQPCDIDAIDKLAKERDLKLVYDAAHCFGSRYNGKSVLAYGDAATLSFQATKIFQTGEGGAILTKNRELAAQLRQMRIFGMAEGGEIQFAGLNAKMSELNAAFGLALLPRMDEVLAERRVSWAWYAEALSGNARLTIQSVKPGETNFSYFPVAFSSESMKNHVLQTLQANQIFPRQYFKPSLDTIAHLRARGHCPTSRDVSDRILCLPIYHGIEPELVDEICGLILGAVKTFGDAG